MSTVSVKIGPGDHGRRMSLARFESAEVQEGMLYELGRGVIVVSEVPRPSHAQQIYAVRLQAFVYAASHPGRIYSILGGSNSKLLAWSFESERHPDVVIYLTPPRSDDSLVWRSWLPEIVIEVVSPGSEKRDYEEKREEYLALGIKEYWIIDARRKQVLILKRSGDRWRERTLHAGDTYRTRLLAGFEFAVSPVLEAGRRKRRGNGNEHEA